jgi:hypothetical protein
MQPPEAASVLEFPTARLAWSELNMNAFVTAVLMGVAMLALAIWVEVRERRPAPGDGNYRSSRPRS